MSREKFIDVAKGIGITLVVLGHLNAHDQVIRNIIYAFHMPFFFIVSGVFVNTQIGFKQYLIKNFRRTYCPFLFFSLIEIILKLLYDILRNLELVALIPNSIYSLSGLKFTIINRPLWFLFVLFVIQVVYYLIEKSKTLKIGMLFLGLAIVMGSKYVHYPKNCLWIVAIPCLSFYIIGNIFKKCILSLPRRIKNHTVKYLVISFFLIGIFILCAIKNECVDMSSCNYGNWLMYILSAFMGTFILLIVSVMLSEKRNISNVLTFLGENSIVILVSHYYLCRIFFPRLMIYLGLQQYIYSYVTQLILLTIIVGLMIPIILFSNKYGGFVFGRKKHICKK